MRLILTSLALALALPASSLLAMQPGSDSPSLSGTPGAPDGPTLTYTCRGCHGVAGYKNAYPSYHVPKLVG